MSVAWFTAMADERCSLSRCEGLVLASGSGDGTCIVWNCDSEEHTPLHILPHSSPVLSVAFDPAGGSRLLVSGTDGGEVIVWDTAPDERQLAAAMAWHARLGAASLLRELEPGLLRTILDALFVGSL